jgi:hypothetical protein
MGAVYKEMVRNLKLSITGPVGQGNPLTAWKPPTVERYVVKFGSVEKAQGLDPVRRRAHVAMLEDPGFCEMLVLINRIHL